MFLIFNILTFIFFLYFCCSFLSLFFFFYQSTTLPAFASDINRQSEWVKYEIYLYGWHSTVWVIEVMETDEKIAREHPRWILVGVSEVYRISQFLRFVLFHSFNFTFILLFSLSAHYSCYKHTLQYTNTHFKIAHLKRKITHRTHT